MAAIAWALIFVGGCILHAGGIQSLSGKEAALAGMLICLIAGVAFLLALAMPLLKRHGNKPLSELMQRNGNQPSSIGGEPSH